MSVDYSEQMIVGLRGKDIDFPDPDDVNDFIDEHGLFSCSDYMGADIDRQTIGFVVNNGIEEKDLEAFLQDVKSKMAEFKALFGQESRLFAARNIW